MTVRRAASMSAFALAIGTPWMASAQPAGATTSPPTTAPTTAASSAASPPSTAPPEPKESLGGDPSAKKEAPAAEAPPEGGHFRWGLSPKLGTFLPGPTTFAFGIEGRAGWALNQTVTFYGSVGGVGGVGFGADVNSNGVSGSVSAVSYWYLGANVDALLAGPLFVAGGAAIGRGGWGVVGASASSAGGSQETIAAGGLMPSLDAQIGLSTGTTNPKTGKRSGFAISFDLRVLVAPDSVSTKQSVTTAGASQSVTASTTAVGFSPMLMLGYDSR